VKRGLLRSGKADETWAYPENQAADIQVVLGAGVEKQAEAMKKILKASRLFRRFTIDPRAEAQLAEVSEQLKGLQGACEAFYGELDGIHMNTYVALVKTAAECGDRVADLQQEVDWLRAAATQALEARPTNAAKQPPQAALQLYIFDLVRVFGEYGPRDAHRPEDRLGEFVRACTAGLVQWEGQRGAQDALRIHLKERGIHGGP
jgi:hypothetical protein